MVNRLLAGAAATPAGTCMNARVNLCTTARSGPGRPTAWGGCSNCRHVPPHMVITLSICVRAAHKGPKGSIMCEGPGWASMHHLGPRKSCVQVGTLAADTSYQQQWRSSFSFCSTGFAWHKSICMSVAQLVCWPTQTLETKQGRLPALFFTALHACFPVRRPQ